MTTKRYSTRDEAIYREITSPLQEFAADHDIDAIADLVINCEETRKGVEYFCAVDTQRFWKIVQDHPYKG